MTAPKRDTKLIDLYVERNPNKPGRDEAVITSSGVPVWSVVAYFQGVADLDKVACDFELPLEAVKGALEYYYQNKDVIDARIEANDA